MLPSTSCTESSNIQPWYAENSSVLYLDEVLIPFVTLVPHIAYSIYHVPRHTTVICSPYLELNLGWSTKQVVLLLFCIKFPQHTTVQDCTRSHVNKKFDDSEWC